MNEINLNLMKNRNNIKAETKQTDNRRRGESLPDEWGGILPEWEIKTSLWGDDLPQWDLTTEWGDIKTDWGDLLPEWGDVKTDY
ncbi:MAG TPA: hypothetical protein PLQ09_01780 [Prolixibacteraceae bacterium]|nr:hypothetical protein [Prolixibacteraceae bacterium]